MPQSHSELIYHIVFSIKDRQPWLDDKIRPWTASYIAGVIANLRGRALIVNGWADHLHVLARLPPSLAIAKAVQAMKANSSKEIKERFGLEAFAWQNGYGVFSVSLSEMDGVYQYIVHQEKRHKSESFKDEYIELLRQEGAEFDEDFLGVSSLQRFGFEA